jgi:hypothetical protein
MTTPRPKRRVTASKRALEALEASQVLPTPQSTAVHKRQRVYKDPNNDDDLDRYAATQMEVMQPQPIPLPSSPPLSPAPQLSLPGIPPMPPVLRSLTQELERELADTTDEDDAEMIEGSQGVRPSQEQDPVEALRYDLQVVFKGATRGVTSVNRSKYVRGVEGVGHHVALDQCMKWWSQDPQGQDWRIVRKEVVVTHAVGKKTAIDYRNDLAANHVDDWEDALEVAVALMADNCYGIKLTVTCDVDYVAPPAIIVDAPTPPVVPAMASLPATASTSRGRQSATNIMLADMTPQLILEAANKDFSTQLRLQWACKNQACPNYPRVCYVVGHGPPSNSHYPLYAEQVIAWCADLKERDPSGSSSIEVPAIAVFVGLKKAKDAMKDRRDNRQLLDAVTGVGSGSSGPITWQPPQSTSMLPNQPFNVNIFNGNAPPAPVLPVPQTELRSSPSAVSDADRELDEFFDWCHTHRDWQGRSRADDLLEIKELCITEDFTLGDMKQISLKAWQQMKLKSGQHNRLRRCIIEFKQEKRAIR